MEFSLSETTAWAIFLKPFIGVAVFAGIVYPLMYVLRRNIPEGKAKSWLFRERHF